MQKVTYKYLREFVTKKNKTSLPRQDAAALFFLTMAVVLIGQGLVS